MNVSEGRSLSPFLSLRERGSRGCREPRRKSLDIKPKGGPPRDLVEKKTWILPPLFPPNACKDERVQPCKGQSPAFHRLYRGHRRSGQKPKAEYLGRYGTDQGQKCLVQVWNGKLQRQRVRPRQLPQTSLPPPSSPPPRCPAGRLRPHLSAGNSAALTSRIIPAAAPWNRLKPGTK